MTRRRPHLVAITGIRTTGDFDTAFTAMTKEQPDALLTVVDAFTLQNRKRIIDFAAARRIASVYETREFVDSGGLISYGPSLADNYRRAAAYVDKILKGAKPAELPRAPSASPFRRHSGCASTSSSTERAQLSSTRCS